MRSSCLIVLIVISVTMIAGRSLDERDRSYFNELARRFNDGDDQLEQNDFNLRHADDEQNENEFFVNTLRYLFNKRVLTSKFHRAVRVSNGSKCYYDCDLLLTEYINIKHRLDFLSNASFIYSNTMKNKRNTSISVFFV